MDKALLAEEQRSTAAHKVGHIDKLTVICLILNL